jgi:hypothetical protein
VDESWEAEGVKLAAELQPMDSNSGSAEFGRELTASAPVRDLDMPTSCGEAAPQCEDVTFSTAPVDARGNQQQPGLRHR